MKENYHLRHDTKKIETLRMVQPMDRGADWTPTLWMFSQSAGQHGVDAATDMTALYSLQPSWVGEAGHGLTG